MEITGLDRDHARVVERHAIRARQPAEMSLVDVVQIESAQLTALILEAAARHQELDQVCWARRRRYARMSRSASKSPSRIARCS